MGSFPETKIDPKKMHPVISPSGHKPPHPPLTCIEINSLFYDVLKLKKASKCKKYYDQHCYVASFETLLFVWLQAPADKSPPPI